MLGVSVPTLRRWEAAGKLIAEHAPGGHRRYDFAELRPELFRAADTSKRKTVAYARVSSHDQKQDLERRKSARQGWTFDVVADLGSGMNDHKKGLQRLLCGILDDQVGRLVLVHKDRLLRFELNWCSPSPRGAIPPAIRSVLGVAMNALATLSVIESREKHRDDRTLRKNPQS